MGGTSHLSIQRPPQDIRHLAPFSTPVVNILALLAHLFDGAELGEELAEGLVLHLLVHVRHVHATLVVLLVASRLRPVDQQGVVLKAMEASQQGDAGVKVGRARLIDCRSNVTKDRRICVLEGQINNREHGKSMAGSRVLRAVGPFRF